MSSVKIIYINLHGMQYLPTAGQNFLKAVVGLVLTRRTDHFPKIVASRTPISTRLKQGKILSSNQPISLDFGLRKSSSQVISSGRSPCHRLCVCVGRCFGGRPTARIDFYGYRRQISATRPKQTKIETCTARLDFGLRKSSSQDNTSCSFLHHCLGVCVGRCFGRKAAARIDF